MAEQLIRDEYLFDRKCYESVSSDTKGILRTVKGPIAEWENLNRNGRKYSERLWDNVLESPYVKEQMGYKSLFGEANHPSDRFEIDFSRVSHVITEMHKVPDKKQVYASIDILDTPLGNILNTLYEYGSVIGYSSRAGGVLRNKKGYIEVDEDSYHFITFDAVPYPSVETARPISEGVEIPDNERVMLSEEVHKKLKEIIESSNKNDVEVIKDFIYSLRNYDLDKEISLLEGIDSMTNVEEGKDAVKNTTLCLLKESYRQIQGLKDEVSKSKENYLINEGELKNSLKLAGDTVDKLSKDLKDMTLKFEEVSKSLGTVTSERDDIKSKFDAKEAEFSSFRNTISESNMKIGDLELQLDELSLIKEEKEKVSVALTKVLVENSQLKDSEKKLKEEIASKVNESGNMIGKKEYDEVVGELSSSVKEINSLAKENENLVKKNEENIALIQKLTEQVESLTKEKEQLGINESTYTNKVRESSEKVTKINEELVKTKTTLTKITEESNAKMLECVREMVDVISGKYGIKSEVVLSKLSITKDVKAGDIYSVCEDISRNAKLEIVVSKDDEVGNEKVESPKNARLESVYSAPSRRGI